MDFSEFLRIEKVSKTFPGVRALNDISLSIRRGEIHALIGENGAGKSTLIKILSGVYQPDDGAEIVIEGWRAEGLSPIESAKRGIAVIYQDFSLFPNLTVGENIAVAKGIEKGAAFVQWRDMRRTAGKILERLGVDIDIDVQLGTLSIARQQLVAISRALTYNAKLIIMDEPTSALSKGEVDLLFRIMRSLRAEGISFLFVSHKLDELFAISDRFTVLRDGKYLGTFDEEGLDDDRLISLMVGRKIEYTIFPKRKRTEPVLEVRDISRIGCFRNISFELRGGEILGLTGLVGAGRTEILQAIYGINPPDSGKILLHGKEVSLRSPIDSVNHGIAYVPENRLAEGLVLRKTIAENIVVTVLDKISNRFGLIERDRQDKLAQEWIQRLNIRPNLPEMQASKLSGGNQQRVVIVKWLARESRILLVDEPTNGIDVGAKMEIHRILRDLAEAGISIILVSSELPEILAIADRVIVMRRGRIAGQFDGETVTQEMIMEKAILGIKQQVN
jgi:ABC-type sugar transport system ATPase subunit